MNTNPEAREGYSKIIGYARVSTEDQNLDMQLKALKEAGCDTIYQEKKSGKKLEGREQFEWLNMDLDRGDVLVVWKLDRIGRNSAEVIAYVDDLAERGIQFVSLTEGFDTRTPFGRAFLGILAVLAQLERDMTAERTRAGMEAAKAAGKPIGRKPSITPDAWHQAQELIKEDKYANWQKGVADKIGVSREVMCNHWPKIKKGLPYPDTWWSHYPKEREAYLAKTEGAD